VVPLLLFVILFGLSMDYHVFIISRIRETFDRGASTDEAIAHGIKSTAGVVTSAALVLVSVVAIFGTLSMLFFKQFDDEAARRRELVPAALARVAPAPRAPGAADRPGGGPDSRLGVVPAWIRPPLDAAGIR
jgi:hypothetical protein